jgi:phospholipase/lecithinase/hemolysin
MSVHARRAKLRLFSILLAFIVLAPACALADGERHGLRRPFDRIVVFGTSLSDPGNGHFLNGNLTRPPEWPGIDPVTLVPASEWPYAAGGGRFSNGPTWVEQLARPIGLASSVKAAFDPHNRGGSNFAVGGATARTGTGETALSDQLTRFFEARRAGLRTSADTLYVIEMGGNDLVDALEVASGPGGVQAAVLQVLAPTVTAVSDAIFLLWRDAGAKNFLVWNVPNLGLAPAITRLGPAASQGATALTSVYNNGIPGLFPGLAGALGGLSTLPGIHIVTFDAFATINKLATEPVKFGLQNVTDTCISLAPPFICSNPNRYLFWDGIHPTRAGHAIVAFEVGKALSADLLAH